jgi:hypothetical protein
MHLHRAMVACTAVSLGLVFRTSLASGQASNRLRLSDPVAILTASDATVNIGPNLRAAIGPNGQIGVAEGDGAYVGLIDGRGRLRRRDREGNGPGEFRQGLGVGWRADTLVVTDSRTRRRHCCSMGA